MTLATETESVQVEQLMQANPCFWAVKSKIRLSNNVIFSFQDRPYLEEPMGCEVPVAGAMKGTGGGFSECMGILPSLHGMRYGRYPQGVGYFFPTDTDMQDYVKSRFNPVIQNNRNAIGKYLKRGARGTDSAGLKRVGNSNLYLRGSTLMPGDEGGDAKKSTKLQGIQIDRLVVDEIDQVEPEAISKMRGRMGNAAIDGVKGKREERYIANPSDEDRGIDLYWQRSDQRYWYSRCLFCGGLTCTVKEFINDPEKSVGLYPESPDGVIRGYMKCTKCGKPLGFNDGEYIADRPSVKDLVMYQWSHLASAYHDPARILKNFRDPPEGNLGDIYRLDLGLAYSSSDEKLRKNTVLACCGSDGMRESHPGQCAMGVDNDDRKHVVIGTRTGNDRYEIVKVATVDTFGDVHDLGLKYGVKFAVGDLRPNAESARQFQRGERYKVFLCEYTDSPLQDATFNDNNGIVKVYRTGIFDTSHGVISGGRITLPRQCAAIDDFAQQCCNCVKSKETDKRRNRIIYRYKKTGNGNDHFRNALNYFLIAANKVRITRDKKYYRLQALVADNNYARV